MPKLFALLVGINEYEPNTSISSLKGCVNDSILMEAFLAEQFPTSQRIIQTLHNEQATYSNVIQGFENHLMNANANDIVLFAFSGHGSREAAPLQFAPYFPEGKQETLVLYDSRTPQAYDLSDKELAFLLEEVSKKGAHAVVILDCCHSGSATKAVLEPRITQARQVADRKEIRSIDSFLLGFKRETYGNEYLIRRFGQNGEFYLPSSKHILLSACRRDEFAYELSNNRGLFSYHLLKILGDVGGNISYADLYAECRGSIAREANVQHPQFETYGYFNGFEPFLLLGETSKSSVYRLFSEQDLWQTDMGVIDGLPAISNQATAFDVFLEGTKVGQAKTTYVGLEKSVVYLENFNPEKDKKYTVQQTSFSEPKQIFSVQGRGEASKYWELYFNQFQSLYFQLAPEASKLPYSLSIAQNELKIVRNHDKSVLKILRGNTWARMFQVAFETLEIIASWERITSLYNKGSRIPERDVQIIIKTFDEEGGPLAVYSQQQLNLQFTNTKRIRFSVELRNNNSQKSYHCSLFYCSSFYGVFPVGYQDRIPAANSVIAWDRAPDGSPLFFEPTEGQEQDTLLVFISHEPLELNRLQQEGIAKGQVEEYWQSKNTDNDTFEIAKSRRIGGFGPKSKTWRKSQDWRTISMIVTCS